MMIAMCAMAMPAQREYSKEEIKEAQKEAKARAKELTKSNWIYDGTRSLESVLEKYNLNTSDDCGDFFSYTEEVTAKSISIAKNNGMTSLTRKLAQVISTVVKGTIDAQITEDEEFNDNKMSALYSGEISACVREAFSIYKKTPDGKYDVRIFYLVNKERFEKLCKKASSDAVENSKRADNIRESVNRAHEE